MATFDQVFAAALADLPEVPAGVGTFEYSLRAFEAELAQAFASAAPSALQPREFVLGVDLPRSKTELRRAFRRMALETHPDRPGGSHDAFLRTMTLFGEAERALATEARSAF